jgi:hypothetical protein
MPSILVRVAGQQILTTRALNRALLARQFLLERAEISALEMIERLVGIQAQIPNGPYVALWSRQQAFRPDELSGLLEDRRVVRTSLMRSTIHLVTADDCLALRPIFQPLLERAFSGQRDWAKAAAGVNLDEVLDVVRTLIEEQPRTGAELRMLLDGKWPGRDAGVLAMAAKFMLPVVQVPPRGVWGKTLLPTWTTIEGWLGRPLERNPSVDDLFLRYLAAFGPASMADFRRWSRLTGHTDIVGRLRPRLLTFRDENGRELFDLPDAPRPDPGVPAPPRFFPDYDNVFLGHADRTRIIDPMELNPTVIGTSSFTLDGFFAGTWKVDRTKTAATLLIDPLKPLSKADRSALTDEAAELLTFLQPGAEHDVRLVAA